MDWMDDLQQRLQTGDSFQISIDGQLWNVEARQGGLTFTNEFGRTETFQSGEQLATALQSWYENPIIIVK